MRSVVAVGGRYGRASVRSCVIALALLTLSALASNPSAPSSPVTASARPAETAHLAPQMPELAPPPDPVPWATPADALAVVELDAQTVPVQDLPFTRWLFSADPAALEDWQALSHGLGLITNAGSLELTPGVVARPVARRVVARIDLRWYAPRVEDLERWLRLWEDFAFDPAFSFLYTQDALKLLTAEQRAELRVPLRKPGRVWDEKAWKWTAAGKPEMTFPALADMKTVPAVVKVNPFKLSAAGYERLQVATCSAAPIVSVDYFLARALSTIKRSPTAKQKIDTVFDTIWGGRYHELANTPRSKVKGVSDLDALLGFLRIGDGKQNFAKVLDGLRSAGRVVTILSEVTGKRRMVVLVYSPSGNPAVVAPLLAITFDILDDDRDLGTDPLISFVAALSKAHRVIWLDATGTQRFALYNADGELVDEVPIDVATDPTVPRPYTPRLETIGCIRCHGAHAGYQPLVNDLRDIFRYNPKQLLAQDPETRDRVAAWHAGDVGKPLSRARDDYSAAVLMLTGRWQGDLGNVNTVKFSSARLGAIFARDRYDLVDAATALRRLGVPDPPKGQELATLRALLPEVEVEAGVFLLDDLRLEALRTGKRITPYDFALLRSFLQERLPARAAK